MGDPTWAYGAARRLVGRGSFGCLCGRLDRKNPEEGVSCVPDAVILSSPAVSLEQDHWFRELLGDRAPLDAVSPDAQVHPGMPPALILQGREDTVTPLKATRAGPVVGPAAVSSR